MQPDFSTYIEYLRKIVRRTCPRCHSTSCIACGETISEGKGRRPAAAKDDDPLFHCSNLQGVILGIGLLMLEQAFSNQSHELVDDHASRAKNNKRRRMDVVLTQKQSHDFDDDENVYYLSTPGKKAKGGIGYAGDQREDVSVASTVGAEAC